MATTILRCGCSYTRSMFGDGEYLWIHFCWTHKFIDGLRLTLNERIEMLEFWVSNEWMLEADDTSH